MKKPEPFITTFKFADEVAKIRRKLHRFQNANAGTNPRAIRMNRVYAAELSEAFMLDTGIVEPLTHVCGIPIEIISNIARGSKDFECIP